MIVIDILTKNTSDKSGIRPRMVALVDSGAAYEFVRDMNGNWSQATYFKTANAQSDDAFESAIAYEGNTLIVARAEKTASLPVLTAMRQGLFIPLTTLAQDARSGSSSQRIS